MKASDVAAAKREKRKQLVHSLARSLRIGKVIREEEEEEKSLVCGLLLLYTLPLARSLLATCGSIIRYSSVRDAAAAAIA